MKRLFVFLVLMMALAAMAAETVSYSSANRPGRRAVKKITVNLDNAVVAPGETFVDMNDYSLTLADIYGYIERIVIDSNGTETDWTVTLKDETGYSIFSKTDCSSAVEPYSFAIYEDDTEGNPWRGIPMAGSGTLLVADVNYSAEVVTVEINAAATAGPWQITYGGQTTTAIDEVVTITDFNDPNGGDFVLTFDSQTTAVLDYNSTAAEIDTALEALSSIGTGEVAVTGGPLPDTAVVITFAAGLGAQDVGAIDINDANVTATDVNETGGFTATVTTAGDGLIFDSNTTEILAAMEALSTVTAGDVNVAGGDMSSTDDLTFTFLESLGNVGAITLTTTYLTGPTTVTVTETNQGGNDLDDLRIYIYYRQENE